MDDSEHRKSKKSLSLFHDKDGTFALQEQGESENTKEDWALSKAELIEDRKQQIINHFGYQSEEDIEEILLNWFLQEFFNGEITKNELDEYASEMGYSVEIGIEGEESLDENNCPLA